MIFAGVVGSLVLFCFVAAVPFVIGESMPKRLVRRLTTGPTVIGALVSGALIGVFAGFIPACIVYAASGRGWAAGIALATCSLACGIAWCRFERRVASPRQKPARPPATPYLRKLDQTPARISEPPAI
jgi:hypothetical protein